MRGGGRDEWILATTADVTCEEAVRAYGTRWSIEVAFKVLKSGLVMRSEAAVVHSIEAICLLSLVVALSRLVRAATAACQSGLRAHGRPARGARIRGACAVRGGPRGQRHTLLWVADTCRGGGGRQTPQVPSSVGRRPALRALVRTGTVHFRVLPQLHPRPVPSVGSEPTRSSQAVAHLVERGRRGERGISSLLMSLTYAPMVEVRA